MQEKKAKVSNFFERISKIIDFYGINSVNSFEPRVVINWKRDDVQKKRG